MKKRKYNQLNVGMRKNQIIDSTDNCVKNFPCVEISESGTQTGRLKNDNDHALSSLGLKYQTHSSESEAKYCETHDQVGLKMESETAGSQTGLDIEP